MAYVFWALEHDTKRTSYIDYSAIVHTRREALESLFRPTDTPHWRAEKERRLAAKRIRAVKVIILTLEEYRKLENP